MTGRLPKSRAPSAVVDDFHSFLLALSLDRFVRDFPTLVRFSRQQQLSYKHCK